MASNQGIKTYEDQKYAVDSALIFLHFVLYLQDMLSSHKINKNIIFGKHYLSDKLRFHLDLTKLD
jgi:hypothetical protein